MSSYRHVAPSNLPVTPEKKINLVQQNSCYWITSLIYNGEELAKNYDRHIFCFHPDGRAEFCNDLFCEQGQWKMDSDIMEIAINASSVDNVSRTNNYNWLNGTWRIVERSESTLVLEKIGKDYWRVSFITNGR